MEKNNFKLFSKQEYKDILKKMVNAKCSPIVKIGEISDFIKEVENADILLSELISENYENSTYLLFGVILSAIKCKEFKTDENVLNDVAEFFSDQELDKNSENIIVVTLAIINFFRPNIYPKLNDALNKALKKVTTKN